MMAGAAMIGPATAAAAPPAGFTLESWPGDWSQVCGIVPVGDGRFVAWGKAGVAWMVGADGIASTEPLLDISEEVGDWREHGLLGLVLDPDYLDNGHIYLLYAVDRHHLLFHGTKNYDPAADWYNAATIGRITRYTATAESDRSVIDPSTRHILLGESITTGLPILHQSHALGTLMIGDDGTLLCSMGDSGEYGLVDTGGEVPGGWVGMALQDGIIGPRQDVGAYRAQLIDSLCGKVLRLDPETGNGVPSNPWFDAGQPRSPRSRVWATGLRNAYRMSLVRGTGSTNPAAADPGMIVYGDVGWSVREEAGIIDGPGLNLGWPLFEGLDPQNAYWDTDIENPLALNPLAAGDCPTRFRFRDLLVEEGEVASNPCDPAWLEPVNWSGPSFDTTWAGHTGDGYLDFGSGVGEWIDFDVTIPDDEPRDFAIRFANGGSTNRPVEVLVDGFVVTTFDMPPTGGWTRWSKAWMTLPLPAGDHTIRIRTTINNGPNIDRIDAPDLPFTPIDTAMWRPHHRPTIDWKHGANEARVPTLDSAGAAWFATVGQAGSPVTGSPFGGACATGGVLVDDPRWPAEYRGMYFADYVYGWIRLLRFDAAGNPESVVAFDNTAGPIVAINFDPVSGDLLAIRWDQNPIRIVPPAPACPADLDGDGQVAGGDLGLMLAGWNQPGASDLDHDGTTNGSDLGLLLSAWGVCPP
jgi:glucose/arabinose dehydrogenase